MRHSYRAALPLLLALAPPVVAQPAIDFTARGLMASRAAAPAIPATYNRSADTLRRWWACLAKMQVPGATQHCLILEVGDSKTAGTGAGTGNDSQGNRSVGAALRNRTAFEARYLNAAGFAANRQGWCGSSGYARADVSLYDPRRIIPADWSNTGGIGGNIFYATGTIASALTFAPDAAVPINQVDTWFATGGGLGTAQVSDGTASQTYNTNIATGQLKASLPLARGAGKTIAITRASGGNIIPLCQLASDTTIAAIDIVNAGAHGTTTGAWNRSDQAWSPIPAIKAIAPDLTIVQLYTNDPTAGLTQPQTIANLQAIWAAAKATGDCLALIPTRPDAGKATSAQEMALEAPVKAAAIAAGCAVLSLGEMGRDYPTATALGLAADGVSHETAPGYAAEAAAIVRAILP